MHEHTRKIAFNSLAAVVVLITIFGNLRAASAAVVFDQTNGVYTDDFADATGIASSSNAGVDVADGTVKLQNAGGAYAAPYSASGTVTLSIIRPLRVAKWGTLSIVASTPSGTSIKAQAQDGGGFDDDGNIIPNHAYRNVFLPGNEIGISSFPIDMSNVSVLECADQYFPGDPGSFNNFYTCLKPGAVSFKFTLETSDPSVTPSIDSVRFTWTTVQGDLSASPPSTGPWPTFGGNQQRAFHSPYANTAVYPAFRWAGVKQDGNYAIAKNSEYMRDSIYVLDDKVIAWSAVTGYGGSTGGHLFAVNPTTGAELWNIPFHSGWGMAMAISQDGTLYATEDGADRLLAIDTNTGQVKWTYNFYGGHANGAISIGADGTIYTIRNDRVAAPPTTATYLNLTVYAFNPDSTIKWTSNTTVDFNGLSGFMETSAIAIGPDGTLYFGTGISQDSRANFLDTGKLYAVDPIDGRFKWSFASGDVVSYAFCRGPLVDGDAIYIGKYFSEQNGEVKVMAVNFDGTLKWERSFGVGDIGIVNLSLASDGNLLAFYERSSYTEGQVLKINKADGSVVSGDPTPMTMDNNFSDGVNGVYFLSNDWSNIPIIDEMINYMDADQKLRWQIVRTSNIRTGGETFTLPSLDKNGWIQGALERSNGPFASRFARLFALAPWTLTPTVSALTFDHGDALHFSVTTSMQQTNPLTSNANQIHIILDNGVVVPLAYSSTNGSGDTVWTGSYVIPESMAYGTHSYTVEANADMVKTDITVAFDTPAAGSNNTGLTAQGTFDVIKHRAPSGGSNATVRTPAIAVATPSAGASYKADATVGLGWSATDGDFAKYKVSYSSDNGTMWTAIADNLTASTLSWIVPDTGTTTGQIKVEGYGASNALLAAGTSGDFTVIGETEPEAPENPNGTPIVPPMTDPTVTGTYTPAESKENNPDFNTDMGLIAPSAGMTVNCTVGTLIKGSFPAVYYCGKDGKRYVFVNDKSYFSWYPDFSQVKVISDADLAQIPIGGNITYRPGAKLVKVQTDPKVYAVARGGILRWLESETVAARLYGVDWNKQIDYIPVAFFVNYKIGDPIYQ